MGPDPPTHPNGKPKIYPCDSGCAEKNFFNLLIKSSLKKKDLSCASLEK